MNRQACGLLISLISHTVVILFAVVIGTTSALMNTKSMVIDLSILESVINSPGPEALAWRMDYNEYRPHSSLDYKTPDSFARSRLTEAGELTL